MKVLALLLQVAVVFAIFGAAMWFLKRHGSRTRGTAAEHVSVVATAPLGRAASVAVVRIGDKTFALGVTDGAVSNLGEIVLPVAAAQTVTDQLLTEPSGVPQATAAPGPATFWQRFEAAAKSQGAAPASLVAGIGYVARALTKARKATPAPAPGFHATLAAAAQATADATEPAVQDEPTPEPAPLLFLEPDKPAAQVRAEMVLADQLERAVTVERSPILAGVKSA